MFVRFRVAIRPGLGTTSRRILLFLFSHRVCGTMGHQLIPLKLKQICLFSILPLNLFGIVFNMFVRILPELSRFFVPRLDAILVPRLEGECGALILHKAMKTQIVQLNIITCSLISIIACRCASFFVFQILAVLERGHYARWQAFLERDRCSLGWCWGRLGFGCLNLHERGRFGFLHVFHPRGHRIKFVFSLLIIFLLVFWGVGILVCVYIYIYIEREGEL